MRKDDARKWSAMMRWLALVSGARALARFGLARQRDGGRDQRPEQIDGVIVVGALQDGGDALDPHAGVDGGVRQGHALPARQLLILHEDEIPDLDEAVALGVRTAGRARLRCSGPWS